VVLGAGLDSCGRYHPPPGLERRTVQLVASHYTDYALRPTNGPVDIKLNSLDRCSIDHNTKSSRNSLNQVALKLNAWTHPQQADPQSRPIFIWRFLMI